MKSNLFRVALVCSALCVSFSAAAAESSQTNSGSRSSLTNLFPDRVVAKGKGFEVRQSEVDDAFTSYKASMAARGQAIPEYKRAALESNFVDRIITVRVLGAKATQIEKDKAKEKAARYVADMRQRAKSEDDFKRELTANGTSPQKVSDRLMEQALCEEVIDRELKSQITVTDEQVKKFYDDNSARFEMPEQVRASHILIGTVDPSNGQPIAEEQRKVKRQLADKVQQRAKAGEDFAKLAKEFSEDPGSKDNGGEYTFPRGQMVPEFETTAFSTGINQVSDVVTTKYGFHIIKVSERIPAKKITFEEVQKEIRERLVFEETQKRLPEYLEKVKKEADVELMPVGKS